MPSFITVSIEMCIRDRRNRWRRQQVPDSMKDEIMPNNIIMIGPTGVGKTEIARRISKLSNAPFIKVEAVSYTHLDVYKRQMMHL